jgi:hypothetical protein
MSTVSDIVAVLAELELLTRRDPDALERREEILATKVALVERIRAGEEDPPAVSIPSRDDGATLPCPVCGSAFVTTGRRRYCSVLLGRGKEDLLRCQGVCDRRS